MSKRWALPLLLAIFALAYLLPLGSHGLWIPDETRYAQISQDMLLSGNWVSPHFMSLRYFEKPVAGYWMIAIGQALFGDNLFGVRIASALSTGLSVLLCYLIARRLWNEPRKSFACALLYMSFTIVAGQAGYANLDPQFTFWVNLSLVALWFALDSVSRGQRLIGWAVLGLACGMGFMTKGFLAWLLPVLIALPWMIWQKRWRELLIYGPLAIVVAIAVSLPWALAVHAQEPDYWRFFFWHEHIRRFAGDDAQHDAPWWFYLPLLVAFSLPWAALLPSALKQAWHTRRQANIAFLLLWLLMPLMFFSLSNGKLPTYIMPCLLPLALLLGHALADRLKLEQGRVLGLNGLLNLMLGLTTLLALVYLQLKKPLYNHELHNLVLVFIAPDRLDHGQPAASLQTFAMLGGASFRQSAADRLVAGRAARFGGRQQDARPIHPRACPGTRPDRPVAEQRPRRRRGVGLASETPGRGVVQHDRRIEIWPCLS